MFARNGHHVLPNEKHIKGIRKEGRHQEGQPRVHPAEVEEEHVGRDQRYGTWDEDRGDHNLEEFPATWKTKARKSVRNEDATHHGANRPNHRDDECVP